MNTVLEEWISAKKDNQAAASQDGDDVVIEFNRYDPRTGKKLATVKQVLTASDIQAMEKSIQANILYYQNQLAALTALKGPAGKMGG